jgi:predicted  nucleic acid-binding Zn-ribbon protein
MHTRTYSPKHSLAHSLAQVTAERDKLKNRVQGEVGGLRAMVEKAERAREDAEGKLEISKTHFEGEVRF